VPLVPAPWNITSKPLLLNFSPAGFLVFPRFHMHVPSDLYYVLEIGIMDDRCFFFSYELFRFFVASPLFWAIMVASFRLLSCSRSVRLCLVVFYFLLVFFFKLICPLFFIWHKFSFPPLLCVLFVGVVFPLLIWMEMIAFIRRSL